MASKAYLDITVGDYVMRKDGGYNNREFGFDKDPGPFKVVGISYGGESFLLDRGPRGSWSYAKDWTAKYFRKATEDDLNKAGMIPMNIKDNDGNVLTVGDTVIGLDWKAGLYEGKSKVITGIQHVFIYFDGQGSPHGQVPSNFRKVVSTAAVPGEYVIMVKDAAGKFAPAKTPRVYSSDKQAQTVARSMAETHLGSTFVVFKAVGEASLPKPVNATFKSY